MPSKRPPYRVFRRYLLRLLRAISLQAHYPFLLFGLILGFILSNLFSHFFSISPPLPTSSLHLVPRDRCQDLHASCFVFVFATGRSGTQHLSRVLQSLPHRSRRAYITHEEEHLSARTKFVVDTDYRRIAAEKDQAAFNASATNYVKATKLPFYQALLGRAGAKRLVYTGHVPMAFGLGPALIEQLPPLSVRVLRFRRDRIATAVSLMALGPEEEDPWGFDPWLDTKSYQSIHKQKSISTTTLNRRWFPKPTDIMVRLKVQRSVWLRFNRFQKWLWYVDDVECRWQALKNAYQGRFSYMEQSLEALNIMDGGQAWNAIADFVGVQVNWEKVGYRHNSIEYKMRTKINVTETVLRKWDMEYRRTVGNCWITNKQSYGWQLHRRHPYS